MPSFKESLTDAERFAVARYERETLGGEEPDPERIGPDGELLTEAGDPYVDATGNLLNPDGEPLLDEDGRLTIVVPGGQPAA